MTRKWTPGGKAFAAFVRRHGLTPTQVSLALGVARAVVYSWIDGSKRPDTFSRAAVERWTNGEVKAADWWLKSEIADLNAIVVFQPATPVAKRGSRGRAVNRRDE